MIAGTSYNNGAVAIPDFDPRFSGIHTLTHNHPYNRGRMIGGTFSEADVIAHATYQYAGQTRAVSNGPNENTYILSPRRGAKQNYTRLLGYAQRVEAGRRMQKAGQKALDKANKRQQKKGSFLTPKQQNQVYLGTMKRTWKKKTVSNAGFDYIEVKQSRW